MAVIGEGFSTTLQKITIPEPFRGGHEPLETLQALEGLDALWRNEAVPGSLREGLFIDSDPDSNGSDSYFTDSGLGCEAEFAGGAEFGGGVVPVFDDPDYSSPDFREPDPVAFQPSESYPGGGVVGLNPPPQSTEIPSLNDVFGGVPLPRAVPVVLMPVLSLLGLTNEPAWMEGIGPVSMDVARLMTESAPSMYRLLVDPITSQPIEAGVDCYRISKSLRMMLQVRDEYCQFPGCYAKASTSEVDHMEAFAAGGKSTPANLEILCHLCRYRHK
ncbi:HNH endonuclease [Arthrobacter psychrolactophilus]